MNFPKISTLLFTVLLFSLFSCKIDLKQRMVTGKGSVIEKTFPLKQSFDRLSAHQGWDVKLIESDNPHLVVRTQENIFPVFKYEIKNGELFLGFKHNTSVKNVKVQKIEVYYQNLSEISASSSASVHSDELFNQKEMIVNASSSAQINLRLKTGKSRVKSSSSSEIKLLGSSNDFEGKASSSSKIKAADLKIKTARLKASSSGFINTQAVESLEAHSSSSGIIQVLAKITTGNVSASSGGTIKIEGTCETFEGKAGSGGTLDAKNLNTRNSSVEASSGGKISLAVKNSLIAKTSSGGTISYSGNPEQKQLHESTSGGKIRKK